MFCNRQRNPHSQHCIVLFCWCSGVRYGLCYCDGAFCGFGVDLFFIVESNETSVHPLSEHVFQSLLCCALSQETTHFHGLFTCELVWQMGKQHGGAVHNGSIVALVLSLYHITKVEILAPHVVTD